MFESGSAISTPQGNSRPVMLEEVSVVCGRNRSFTTVNVPSPFFEFSEIMDTLNGYVRAFPTKAIKIWF